MTATPSTEHTKEPWSYAIGETAEFEILAADHTAFEPYIATVARQSKDAANARRIAECVNACKGFDSETLRDLCSGGVPTLHEYFIRQRESAARIQSLEAALTKAADSLERASGNVQKWMTVLDVQEAPIKRIMESDVSYFQAKAQEARAALGHQEAGCE